MNALNINGRVVKYLAYAALYLCTGWILIAPLILEKTQASLPQPIITLRYIILIFAGILLARYYYYMMLSPIYGVQQSLMLAKYKDKLETFSPKVSIIIPAWNEEIGLTGTVASVRASTYRNMEIIIVNDGSTDNSDLIMRTRLRSWSRSVTGVPIIYLYQPNGGKGAALNAGIARATGDIIITIDADCLVQKDAIKNFVVQFINPEVMAVVGNVRIGNTKTFLGTLQYFEYLFSFYFRKADSVMNTIFIVSGAAGAYRREVFERVGLFSTTNKTEDMDLSVRIQKAGMKIAYASNAVIHTEGATEFKPLIKQRLRWKRGRFETFGTHHDLFFSTQRQHNKMLSWIILPLAILSDVQLIFEIFFLIALSALAYVTNDYSLFFSAFIVVSFMFAVQMVFDESRRQSLRFYLLAPIGWLMFYVTTLIEVNALAGSLWGFMSNTPTKWQRWNRGGFDDDSVTELIEN